MISRLVLRRGLLRMLAAMGLVLAFGTFLAVGIAIHSNLPMVRALAAASVNRALNGIFYGQLRVEAFSQITPTEVVVSKLEVLDEDGSEVLVGEHLRVHLDLLGLASSLLFDDDALNVVIPHLRLEDVRARLVPAKGSGVTLAHALSLRPKPQTKTGKPKRKLLIWFSNVEIGRAEAHLESDEPLTARATHAQGRLLVSPNQVTVDVDRVAVNVSGVPGGDIEGTGSASLAFPGALTIDVHGFMKEVEFQARARQTQRRISLSLDVPETEPAALKALVPAWPLQVPATLHADAQGDWSNLATSVDLQFAGATLDLDGTLALDPSPATHFEVFAHDLDLRTLAPGAPETSLTLSAQVDAQTSAHGLLAKFSGRTEPTSIVGQPLPRIDVAGILDEHGFDSDAQIFEPGAPMSGHFSVSHTGTIDLDLKAPSVVLEKWSRLPPAVTGSAALELKARLESKRLDASLSADLRNVESHGFRLQRGKLEASASGNIDDPKRIALRGTLEGTNLTREQLAFSTLDLKATGTWPEPHLDLSLKDDKQRHLALRGDIVLAPKVRLHDLDFELGQQDLVLSGKVAEIDPEAGSVDVRDLALSGNAGSLTGYLRLQPGLLETELHGEQLDLAQITAALGLAPGTLRGKAQLNLDLALGHDVTRGSANLILERASFAGIGGTTLRLNAALHEREISGDLSGIDPLFGSFAAQGSGQLAGSALEVKSWSAATGTLEFRSDSIPLTPLRLALGSKSPLTDLDGQAFVRALLQRPTADAPPSLFAEVGASDLAFSVRDATGDAYGLTGAYLDTNLGLNAETGDLTAALSLGDTSGDLLGVSGAMRLDLERLAAKPENVWQVLETTKLDVTAALKPRELRQLPPPLQVTALRGTVGARVSLRGSLAAPTISASVNGEQIGSAGSSLADALNAKAQLDYSPLSQQFNAQATLTNPDGQVADVRVAAIVPWPVAGGGDAPRISGTVAAAFNYFPLSALSVLADNAILGKLSGNVAASFRDGEIQSRATLTTDDLHVGHTSLGAGRLSLTGGMDQLTGQLRLASPASSLVANVHVDAPRMQHLNALAVDVDAHRLEAGLLAPFLKGIASGLAGQLDANLSLKLSRAANDASGKAVWESQLNGTAELSEATAHIEALGMELRDVGWSASARSTGTGSLISFSQVRAKARSAEPNITGSGSLTLHGVDVVSGAATLHLDNVPLTMQGVPKGWGTGNVDAVLTREPDDMLVEVKIPDFLTRLPQSTGRDLIDLKDNPDFNVVELATSSPDQPGLPWRIVIQLGNRVRVTRSDVNLSVTGKPTIDISDTSRLSGNIELTPGGRVQAIGKVFQIEHGSVRLNPDDPENPLVDIRASWRDPEGATLYVGVHGLLKSLDEIEFGSDAGLSKEEIWERLVGVASGASADANDSTGQSGNESAVGRVGAAGVGAAALGLNELFGGSLRDVEIRLDPGQNSSYTAAVRLNDKLWLEGSYQHNDTSITFGEPSNVVTGALDYRFKLNWSLRTELGNAGGTVDLLWQHRY